MIQNLQDTIKLINGAAMPALGLGLYKSAPENDETYNAVRMALDIGYRHIDTATFYRNEAEVGRALKDSGVARDQVFVTTKLWITEFDRCREALEESLRSLRTDYIDAYLFHWPGTDTEARYKAWEVLLGEQQKGVIRCAAVSNFLPHHLEDLISRFGVVPPVNQIELHPWRQQRDNVAYCKKKGIQVVAWGPIFHGHLAEEPLMAEIGAKYGVSPARATLRWHLQKGLVPIPKSVHRERLADNALLFDFALSEDDMGRIDALDGKKRFGWSEDTFGGSL